jgi:hypothetical protein
MATQNAPGQAIHAGDEVVPPRDQFWHQRTRGKDGINNDQADRAPGDTRRDQDRPVTIQDTQESPGRNPRGFWGQQKEKWGQSGDRIKIRENIFKAYRSACNMWGVYHILNISLRIIYAFHNSIFMDTPKYTPIKGALLFFFPVL